MTTTSATRTAVRRLADTGLERFKIELQSLQASQVVDTSWLNADDYGTVLLEDAPPLPLLDTDDKLGSARALSEWFDESGLADRPGIWDDVRLWSWLSAYYLDVLVARRKDGSFGRIGEDARYILNPISTRVYRHLLLGPVTLWRAHREKARFMLHGALPKSGDAYIELLQAGQTLIEPGPLETVNRLYWDSAKDAPKRGFANRNKPGTIRRFRDVLLQLSLTYDVTAMSSDQIVALLPPEFDRFLETTGASK